MNEQNFDYLKNLLKFTGFGEELQAELREKMDLQTPDFTLLHRAAFGDQRTEATLIFKKSDQSGLYFFNRYFLTLKNEQNEPDLVQSFPIGRENNITLKEGFNLLNGRSIHKECVSRDGAKYRVWLQLNFNEKNGMGDFKLKQFHQNYGYDLRQALVKYPIKELEHADSSQLLVRSLERGNRQSATLMEDGREQKIFIEANPQFKSLRIFRSESSRLNIQEPSKQQKTAPEEIQSQKQNLGEKSGDTGAEKEDNPSRKQLKRQRRSLS